MVGSVKIKIHFLTVKGPSTRLSFDPLGPIGINIIFINNLLKIEPKLNFSKHAYHVLKLYMKSS